MRLQGALPKYEEGFSLVEILVVLAILGLIAAIAGPALQRGRQTSVAEFRTKIIHDVTLARIDAISRQHIIQMDFDLANRAILKSDCCERLPFPAGISVTVLTGHELITTDRQAAFVFFPDGSTSGGKVMIADAANRKASFTLNWIDGTASESSDE